ncbi:hypothetical protein G7Y89_g12628 [Cudoniella acicularis]|uniref:Uncharacterized protein n=1 Tax=Cudoniella acicularis TaxID=354080 RepID=A0A8H4R9Q3_9HELO|nr:hypothetical protein G7Y89_g12628 [Cudoniella acicularis]
MPQATQNPQAMSSVQSLDSFHSAFSNLDDDRQDTDRNSTGQSAVLADKMPPDTSVSWKSDMVASAVKHFNMSKEDAENWALSLLSTRPVEGILSNSHKSHLAAHHRAFLGAPKGIHPYFFFQEFYNYFNFSLSLLALTTIYRPSRAAPNTLCTDDLDTLTTLSNIATLIARYNVLEIMYRSFPNITLEKTYEDCLLETCVLILECLDKISQYRYDDLNSIRAIKDWAKKTAEADQKCRGFTVTFEKVIKQGTKRQFENVEDEADSDDSSGLMAKLDTEDASLGTSASGAKRVKMKWCLTNEHTTKFLSEASAKRRSEVPTQHNCIVFLVYPEADSRQDNVPWTLFRPEHTSRIEQLEKKCEALESEQRKKLKRLELENKKLFEKMQGKQMEIAGLQSKLKTSKNKYNDIKAAKTLYKMQMEDLKTQLKDIGNEFGLTTLSSEFYKAKFGKIERAIEEGSSQYFKDLPTEITENPEEVRKQLIANDSYFNSIPISASETSQNLRMAHAQRIISASFFTHIWQPFSCEKLSSGDKTANILNEIYTELAKPEHGRSKGRAATVIFPLRGPQHSRGSTRVAAKAHVGKRPRETVLGDVTLEIGLLRIKVNNLVKIRIIKDATRGVIARDLIAHSIGG